MSDAVRFARRVFHWSGVYGLLVLAPQYLLEERIGIDFPPAITHPEHFYGFVGVALAWQLAFLLIARDPLRHRPLMLPAVAEKVLFAASTFALFAAGRVGAAVVGAASIDLLLAALFLLSWRRLGPGTGATSVSG